jgi:hypothetical protein
MIDIFSLVGFGECFEIFLEIDKADLPGSLPLKTISSVVIFEFAKFKRISVSSFVYLHFFLWSVSISFFSSFHRIKIINGLSNPNIFGII